MYIYLNRNENNKENNNIIFLKIKNEKSIFEFEKLNEIGTNVKKKIQKEENKNKYENVNIKILLDFEKISLNLYDFIKKVSSHREIYEKIRSIILDLKPYYYFISNNLNKFLMILLKY